MPDIDKLVREHCARIGLAAPHCMEILYRRFPKLTLRLDRARALQCEFEGHLRDSYEALRSEGQDEENAWRLARKHFGSTSLVVREIYTARRQSFRCLMVRLFAIAALFLVASITRAPISLVTFLHMPALCLMSAAAVAGFLITRKKDTASVRGYALCGAWAGLLWGIVRVIRADAAELGAGVALTLLSTLYGLWVARPSARGRMAPIMMGLCQAGVIVTLIRIGVPVQFAGAGKALLMNAAVTGALASLFMGLAVFGIRSLQRHLMSVAALGMVIVCIQVLTQLDRASSIFGIFVALSIPPLFALSSTLPLRKLREFVLGEIR